MTRRTGVDAAVVDSTLDFKSHEPLEPLQHDELFADSATIFARTICESPVALTLATKNSGGWTLFSAAHFSLPTSEWQQHLSQQNSADEHPHAHDSHGNRPYFSAGGA